MTTPAEKRRDAQQARAAGAVLLGVAAFFGLQAAIAFGQRADPFATMTVTLAAAGLVSVSFAWVRPVADPAFLGRLVRGLALGLAVYLVVEPPVFTPARAAGADLFQLVETGYWPALAGAALAWWRPSLVVFPAFYVPATRWVADDVSGLPMSNLDIRALCDMAALLGLGACVLGMLARMGRAAPPVAGLCLGFAAIALHLGNYFWSALAKALIGPAPWTWVLENPTENMLLVALHKGTLPSGAWPGVTQMLFDCFAAIAPVANVIVLLVQLAAIAAALSPRVMAAAALAYEGLHTAIWILGGLFFWPWMWINAAILMALRRLPDRLEMAPRLACLLVITSGAIPHLAPHARLAWFDIADIRSPVIELREAGGPWVRVPASFFLSHSYSISHGYHGLSSLKEHYPATIWGISGSLERMRSSGRCAAPAPVPAPETEDENTHRLAVTGAFLRAHHTAMIAREAARWRPHFYMRSHHHPSNPLLYRDFAKVDLSLVSTYRLREISLCLGLADGRLTERLLHETVTEFPLDPR